MEHTNELYHWGVKGMKWGVRRYQNADGSYTSAGKKRRKIGLGRYENKDGSLTSAGKKRMYREQFDMENKERKEQRKYTADPNRWVKEDMERSNRVINDSANLARNLKNVTDKSIRNTPKTRLDLSNMSDQELRNQINRELLERQYNDVFNPPQVSKGKERASKILEVAGDTLVVAGSAVTLALGIRSLIKGN